nr:6-phosphogluconolactonase [Litorivivens lipolytica]
MVEALVTHLAETLKQAVAEQGQGVMLVSGGSSPQPVYEALSQKDLPWSAISIVLVDERWVDVDHPASNEAFIRRHLLAGAASSARFFGMKTSAASPQAGQRECEQRLAVLPAQADICLLGMGNDGHTASLFPYAQGLTEALYGNQRCAAIVAEQSEVTGEHTERMTLTAPHLLAAKQRVLMMTGDEKLSTYRKAANGKDIEAMPVRAILNASEPVSVFWSP